MALVVVFNSSLLLFSISTTVNDSVGMVILSLDPLASSSAMRMTLIQASRTDAESLSLMMISSSLYTTAIAT